MEQRQRLREAVIVEAVRTPGGKSSTKGLQKCGPMGHLPAVALSGLVIREVLERSGVPPTEVEDVVLGCLTQIGEQGMNVARMSNFVAGLPDEAAGVTVNRYCGSGLQACNFAALEVITGQCDVVIAGGVESMSRYPLMAEMNAALAAGYPVQFPEEITRRGLIQQGVSADMIAKKYGLTREQVDAFALWSQQKAVQAVRAGRFSEQIVPVKIEKDGQTIVIAQDEGIRPEALDNPEEALRKMAALSPSFTPDGVHTPANSSQITDGASAVLIMSQEKAEKLEIRPRARFISTAVVGSDPVYMLLGIAPAVRKALARAGLSLNEIDVLEINEAFASAVMAACQELGLSERDPRLNPNGGAIALGHPIGATGAMLLTKALYELERIQGRYALISLCMGGGMGIATIIERL